MECIKFALFSLVILNFLISFVVYEEIILFVEEDISYVNRGLNLSTLCKNITRAHFAKSNKDTKQKNNSIVAGKLNSAGSVRNLSKIKQDLGNDVTGDTERMETGSARNNRTDAVIILTMMRSGSSVIGELFNKRTDVTYFYEPLFPFGERPCEMLAQERVDTLRYISRCQLKEIQPLYYKGFAESARSDNIARCETHRICFTTKALKVSEFLSRDAGFCDLKNDLQVCPAPLNLTAVSRYCKQSFLVAMKVIYLCKLQWLYPLLEDANYNIKVIHLVRDPRATIASRAFPFMFTSAIKRTSDLVCSNQLIPNVNYADEILSVSKLRGKYLRVRHEDFAWNPTRISQKIYDFVGLNMNAAMRKWIENATSEDNDPDDANRKPQSTIRNSTDVLFRWRRQLTIDKVLEIQRLCSGIFEKLGYTVYRSSQDLHNLSILHFTPHV